MNLVTFQGQTIAVKVLKELECQINVSNSYGQKAIYWIVSKCPEIVSFTVRAVNFGLEDQ